VFKDCTQEGKSIAFANFTNSTEKYKSLNRENLAGTLGLKEVEVYNIKKD